MTKEEVLEKYGDVPLIFDHYYKFVFTFAALVAEGTVLRVSVGGGSDDIYKMMVDSNTSVKLNETDYYVFASLAEGGRILWEDSQY